MLLLLVSVVAALALAAPAPGTQGKRLQVTQAPNVVLVASDSFVSTPEDGVQTLPTTCGETSQGTGPWG